MVNRINRNGRRQSDELTLRERRNDASVFNDDLTAKSNGSADETISKFGAIVRKSPTISLVAALAAGLAIGIWVKR